MASKDIDLDSDFSGGRSDPLEDFDLDMNGLGFDEEAENDSRSPATKAISGLREGLTESFSDFGDVAKRLRDATMPPSFRNDLDEVDNVLDEGSERFKKITSDVRNEVSSIAEDLETLAPSGKMKNIVSSLSRRLGLKNEATTSENVAESREKIHERDTAETLNALFERQTRNAIQLEADSSLRDKLRDKTNQVNAETHSELLKSIAGSSASSVNYTLEVTSKYQRKSLELKYKQVFLAQELLSKSVLFYTGAEELLTGIKKNTALPDYQKIHVTEMMHQQTLVDVLSGAKEKVLGNDSYLVDKARNVQGYVLNRLEESVEKMGDISGKLGMAAMAKDLAESMDTETKVKEGLKMGLPMALQWANAKLRGRNGGDNVFAKITDKIYGYMESVPRDIEGKLEKWKSDELYEDELDLDLSDDDTPPLKERIKRGATRLSRRAAREAYGALNYKGADYSLELAGENPSWEWDKKVYRSITEIIPGYLARILQETKAARTGEMGDLLTFNHGTGSFTGATALSDKLSKGVKNLRSVQSHRDAVSEHVDSQFGDFIGGDPERREALIDIFYKTAQAKNLGSASVTRYSDLAKLNRVTDEDILHRFSVMDSIEDDKGEALDKHRALKDLMGSSPDLRELLESIAKVHGREGLEATGLMDVNNNRATFKPDAVYNLLKGRDGFVRDDAPEDPLDDDLSPESENGADEELRSIRSITQSLLRGTRNGRVYANKITEIVDTKMEELDDLISEVTEGAPSANKTNAIARLRALKQEIKTFKQVAVSNIREGEKEESTLRQLDEYMVRIKEASSSVKQSSEGEVVGDKIDSLKGHLSRIFGYSEENEIPGDDDREARKVPWYQRLYAPQKEKASFDDRDKDGDRDGSAEDILKNRKATKDSKKDSPSEHPEGKKPGGFGLLGKLGGLVSSLLGKGGAILGAGASLLGGGLMGPAGNLAKTALVGGGKLALKAVKRLVPAIVGRLGPLVMHPVVGTLSLAALVWSQWDNITGFFEGGVDEAIKKAHDLTVKTAKGTRNIIGDFRAWDRQMRDNMVESVKSSAGDAFDWVKEAASKTLDWVEDKTKAKDYTNFVAPGAFDGKAAQGKINAGIAEWGSLIGRFLGSGLGSMLATSVSTDLLRDGHNQVIDLRMMQYGLPSPASETQMVDNFLMMERVLRVNNGVVQENNQWKFNPRPALLQALFQVSGATEGYKGANRQVFVDWLVKRFMPVYLAHLTAATTLGYKADLSDTNKIAKKDIKEYVSVAVLDGLNPEQVYIIEDNPFKTRGIDGLLTDPEALATMAMALIKEWNPEPTDTKTTLQAQVNRAAAVVAGKSTGNYSDLSVNPVGEVKSPLTGSTKSRALGQGRSRGFSTASAGGRVLIDNGYPNLYPGIDLNNTRLSSIDNLDPAVKDNLLKMAEAYYQATGKTLTVNSGWRSAGQQKAIASSNPEKAARLLSMHQLGFAVDINQADVDELMKLGLLNEYGFNRPLGGGGERWHIEPTVLQGHLDLFKGQPGLMTHLFELGKGTVSAGLGALKGGNGIITRNSKPEVPLTRKLIDEAASKIVAPATTAAMTPVEKILVHKRGTIESVMGEPSSASAYTRSIQGATPATVPVSSPVTRAGQGGRPQDQQLLEIIDQAANKYGIDPQALRVVMAAESSLNPNAVNPINKDATGLGQMMSGSWADWRANPDSRQYKNDRKDPLANAMASAWYVSNAFKDVKALVPGNVMTPVHSYMITLMGPTGAKRFITGMSKNPDGLVSLALSSKAIADNKPYFMSNGRINTFREAYLAIENRLKGKAKSFLLPYPESPGVSPVAPATGDRNNRPVTPTNPVSTPQDRKAAIQAVVNVPRRVAIPEEPSRPVTSSMSSYVSPQPQAVAQTLSIPPQTFKGVETWLSKSHGVLEKILDAVKDIQVPDKETKPTNGEVNQALRSKAPPIAAPFNVSH